MTKWPVQKQELRTARNTHNTKTFPTFRINYGLCLSCYVVCELLCARIGLNRRRYTYNYATTVRVAWCSGRGLPSLNVDIYFHLQRTSVCYLLNIPIN